MAFRSISTEDTASGQPMKTDLVGQILDNEENLNERVTELEAGGSATSSANAIVIANGSIHSSNYFDSLEGVIRYQARSNIRLTTAIISKVGTSGRTGSLEMDILTAAVINGTYASIMSTLPSISATIAASSSINAAFSNASVSQNHWIRVDITLSLIHI